MQNSAVFQLCFFWHRCKYEFNKKKIPPFFCPLSILQSINTIKGGVLQQNWDFYPPTRTHANTPPPTVIHSTSNSESCQRKILQCKMASQMLWYHVSWNWLCLSACLLVDCNIWEMQVCVKSWSVFVQVCVCVCVRASKPLTVGWHY